MSCGINSDPVQILEINREKNNWSWPHTKYPTRDKEKSLDFPSIIWKDKYNENPDEYYNMTQRISDALILNNSTIFKESNPNNEKLYARFLGHIDQKDYIDQTEVYGTASPVKIKDNSFYHEVYEKLISKVTAIPFVFNINITSDDYLDKQLDELSGKIAGLIRNAALDQLQESGVNVEGLKDEKIPDPVSEKQLQNFLDGSDNFQETLYELVQHVLKSSDFVENVIKPAFRESFVVNTEFAHISTSGRDPKVEAVSCKNVQYLSSKEHIKTLEDPSVLACGVTDYISIQEIIRTYGYRLDAIVGVEELKKVIIKLKQGDKSIENYNPNLPLFGNHIIANGEFDWDSATKEIDNFENTFNINRRFFTDIFYPKYGIGNIVTCKFLRHRFYFRILKNKKFKFLINGQNPTAKQVDDFKKRNLDNALVGDFIEVKDDYKAKTGEHIVTIPKEELHEATRIGHSTFVDCGKYKYGSDYIRDDDKPGFPIIMQSSIDKSFVKIGEPIEIMVNKLHRVIDELVNASGFSSATIIDEAQGYDPIDTQYALKKVGIASYNSAKMASAGTFAARHLSQVTTGSQLQDIEQYLQLIGLLKMSYEKLAGVFNQSNPYDGLAETQINISQRESIFGARYQDHNNFISQVLQRISDISKTFYCNHESKSVSLSDGQVKILKKLKGIQNQDYNVFLQNGVDLKNKGGQIDKLMEFISQSGGVDYVDSIIEVLWEDNPMKKLNIFKNKKDAFLKAEQAAQLAQSQAQQTKAQVDQQKARVPIEREDLRGKYEIEKIREKARLEDKKQEFKGKMSDIQEQNLRERALLDKQLESAFSDASSIAAQPINQ